MNIPVHSLTAWLKSASFCFVLLAALPLRAQSPVFSETFESGSLDPAVWTARTNGKATATVQQMQAAHGKSALQIHYPTGERGSYAFVVASHLPEAVRYHCFGRAYVFLSPNMPGSHSVLLNAGTAGYPASNFLEVGTSGGKNVMISYQQNAPNVPRGETLIRGAAYPVGRWFCLEWEFADHPNHIAVWIDGEPAADLAGFSFKPRSAILLGGAPDGSAKIDPLGKKGEPAPDLPAVPATDMVKGFVDFAFGFRSFGAGQGDFDLYFDDIVIDTKRVGPLK